MSVWDLKKYLGRVSRKNPRNISHILDIRLNNYSVLFNDLAPSSLSKRNLIQDFIASLDEASADIPPKYTLGLEIHGSFPEEPKEREERIRRGGRP